MFFKNDMIEVQKPKYLQFPFLIVYFFVILILFVSMFVFAYQPMAGNNVWSRAANADEGGDFNCFYFAGKRVSEGKNFYFPMINDRYKNEVLSGPVRFVYPPLMAYFFMPFSLLSFDASLFTYSLFCVLLLIFSVYILSKFVLQRWYYFFITGIIFLLSPFFLDHLYAVETDIPVLFLIALCLLAFLKRKYKITGLLLATSIMFKLMPIIFLPYFFIKNKKVFYYSIFFIAILVLIFGFDVFTDFIAAITGFASGGITAGKTNNGLGGMIYNRFTYDLFSFHTAQLILTTSIVIISAIFYYLCFKMNNKEKQVEVDNSLILLEFGAMTFFMSFFPSISSFYNGVFYLFIFTAFWNLRFILSTTYNLIIQALFYLSFSQALLFPVVNERPFITIFNFRPLYVFIVVILLWYSYYQKRFKQQI
jgi:hypothetical protein